MFDDGSGKIRQNITNDDLHLLGAGYSIWREKLLPFVIGSRSDLKGNRLHCYESE